MKLKAITTTFDDLEEIWLLDDSEPTDGEIILPDEEREDKYHVEL